MKLATPRASPSPGTAVRSTPSGSFGSTDPLAQRRLHDVENMLGDRDVKIDRMTSKLTESHQEVQRLRAQVEARDKDLGYTKRLVERFKKEQSAAAVETEAHKTGHDCLKVDRARNGFFCGGR